MRVDAVCNEDTHKRSNGTILMYFWEQSNLKSNSIDDESLDILVSYPRFPIMNTKKPDLFRSLIAIFIALATNQISLASANTTKQPIDSDSRLAVYQNREVICGNGSTTYARAETKGYYVNICGDSNGPDRYLGAGKSGQAIILPLQSHNSGKYIAASGNIRYILTSSYLVVTQGGRTILKQRVISWK